MLVDGFFLNHKRNKRKTKDTKQKGWVLGGGTAKDIKEKQKAQSKVILLGGGTTKGIKKNKRHKTK